MYYYIWLLFLFLLLDFFVPVMKSVLFHCFCVLFQVELCPSGVLELLFHKQKSPGVSIPVSLNCCAVLTLHKLWLINYPHAVSLTVLTLHKLWLINDPHAVSLIAS